MAAEQVLLFPPFRLDLATERLWRDATVTPLRPKAFAVLRYLITHPERLVTNDELLQAVWPHIVVSEAMPRLCIREIRKALSDDAKRPQFIETSPRRGYRFIAAVTAAPVPSSEFRVPSSHPSPAPNSQHLTPFLVGRESELAQLHRWLDKAFDGERQVVFVTGEPGIGKTTLVDAFLEQLVNDERVWIGQGQCLEQYGEGEAYLPVLEALGQLCRGPEGQRIINVLSQYAPTWLIQMPALVHEVELEALQRKTAGATRERMLREIAEAIEVLTEEKGLVLVCEDLQCSDHTTLDFIAYLARRRAGARLLVIGTYRPAEVVVGEHSLRRIKQDLYAHGYCEELQLKLLTEDDAKEYLRQRLEAKTLPAGIVGQIHQRTEGNPLFIVNVVEYLIQRRLLVEATGQWRCMVSVEDAGVPDSLRQMIEKQIEELDRQEQQVLEAASVAGTEFTVASVAAALESELGAVESVCEELARKSHFLQEGGIAEWPDGTVSERYHFRHALYQNVLYGRIAKARQVRLHRTIGEWQEAGYGKRTREVAAELAMHFERGRDYQRAVQYLQQAGRNAIQRSANMEAIAHLVRGLELLKVLPDTAERTQQELALQITLGVPLIATKSYGAPEVGKAYSRARELCQQIGETPQLFSVLRGLWVFYLVLGELQTSRELGEQLIRLAQRVQDPALLLEAHLAVGAALLWLGELASAREHSELGTALYDPQRYSSHAFLYGHDPGVTCLSSAARGLWALGYPDQALKRNHEATTLAQALSHPFSLASALSLTAMLYQLRQEEQATQECAEAVITLSTKQGFPLWAAFGTILRGWALTQQGKGAEGIVQIRQGLAAFQATGTGLGWPYNLALLAEAHGNTGQAEEGLVVLTEALAVVDKNGERFYEAELYRLKGELTLQSQTSSKQVPDTSRTSQSNSTGIVPQPLNLDPQAEAEACFLKAIEIARQQQAKSLEIRAMMSLVRLRQQQATQDTSRTTQHEARIRLDGDHQMLSQIYGWFTEGFDTKDLQEAKTLLDVLA